jgi:hypothetical protein
MHAIMKAGRRTAGRYGVAVREIEQFIMGKWGDPVRCEDGIVLTPHFAVVIDGATDITGSVHDGMTAGRFAMPAVASAIEGLPPRAGALAAIDMLSRALAADVRGDAEPASRPAASATIFSRARRELWQVGDVGFWYPGLSHVPSRKLVDVINTQMRRAIITAALLGGASPADILREDPGRRACAPLVGAQGLLANTEDARAGDLAFGVLNGTPVPAALIGVVEVPRDAAEVVIASDGYPALLPSLDEAEENLARLLSLDPLCINELAGTKPAAENAVSFDDRAYLRLAV